MIQNLNAEQREPLSALMDGELGADEIGAALHCAASPQGREAWHLYHLVGDVLRAPQLAHSPPGTHAGRDVACAVRARLAQEPPPAGASRPATRWALPGWMGRVANDPVWRWKATAACACITTVLAWGAAGLPPGGGRGSAPEPAAPSSSVMAVTLPQDGGQSVMLRDPQLDALLAANASPPPPPSATTLQMPAGFLRNAGFSSARAGHDCPQARC